MHSAKPRYDPLDKVQALNRKVLDLVRKKYTGKLILHWCDGEIKKTEYDFCEDL